MWIQGQGDMGLHSVVIGIVWWHQIDVIVIIRVCGFMGVLEEVGMGQGRAQG